MMDNEKYTLMFKTDRRRFNEVRDKLFHAYMLGVCTEKGVEVLSVLDDIFIKNNQAKEQE